MCVGEHYEYFIVFLWVYVRILFSRNSLINCHNWYKFLTSYFFQLQKFLIKLIEKTFKIENKTWILINALPYQMTMMTVSATHFFVLSLMEDGYTIT